MDDDSSNCLLCAEDMGDDLLPAFGDCNHRGVCSVCFTRMRSLLRDFSCPICKKELDSVVCSSTVQSYQQLSIWGTDAGAMFIYDEKAKMFFPRKYHRDKITPLWQAKCKFCSQTRRDVDQLRKHVIADHDMMMCQLCNENLQCFPSEFKFYSKAEYENHLRLGDKAGSQGHPSCEFCRRRYFDKNGLFMHLHVDHFSCHICEKLGIKFKYYNNYKSLEAHFRKDHSFCEDPSCIQKRFIVFSTEFELASHRMQWHPNLQASRNIPITFRSYRERQDNRESEPTLGDDLPPSDSRRRRPGDYDGGIAGSVRNGEWQLELEAPIAGSNRPRAGGSMPSNLSSYSPASAPPPTPMVVSSASAGPEPSWRNGRANNSQEEAFPGLSSSSGSLRQGGAMLGNWGKAASKQAGKISVVKQAKPPAATSNSHPQGMKIPAAGSHPKDMKVRAASTHPTMGAIATAVEAKKSDDVSKVNNQRIETVRAQQQPLPAPPRPAQTKPLITDDYPALLASNSSTAAPTASAPTSSNGGSKASNKPAFSMDLDYPALPRPQLAQNPSVSVQDKHAYPPLPPSIGTGKSKKKSTAPAVSNVYSGLASSIVSSIAATTPSATAVATPAPAETAPKKAASFKNTLSDESEYPTLTVSKKKIPQHHKIQAPTDDSAAAFRSIRASVMNVPQSTVSRAPTAKWSQQQSSAETSEPAPVTEDYPVLTSFRIGVAMSTNPSANNSNNKSQGQPKSSQKKQQKQDLRKIAFNMK